MNVFKIFACLVFLTIMTACGGADSELEKMIPADALGVVSVDVNSILSKSELIKDGKIVIPQDLSDVITANDGALLCNLLNDLPVAGINTNARIYSFFTSKTFGKVVLIALDESKPMHDLVEKHSGVSFTKIGDLEVISQGDNVWAIKDNVLLMATVNVNVELKKVASVAENILSKSQKNITSNKDVMKVVDGDDEINAYFDTNAIKLLLRSNKTGRDIISKLPILTIFTESDIKALILTVAMSKESIDLKCKVKADDNSDYIELLNSTLSEPSNDFLKAIPVSMRYVAAISVKGENFVKLSQMQQLVSMLKKLPYVGRLDFASILSSIDGPLAVGLSPDPVFNGEWNVVVAARSKNPKSILSQISKFATAMGQAPEIRDGEYVYEYNNKQINLGVVDDVIYLKMLDYEQTEGYAYDIPDMRDLFSKSKLGLFVHDKVVNDTGYFSFGMKNNIEGSGRYYTDNANANAIVQLLKTLCTIRPDSQFDDDGSQSQALGGAIDAMQSVY